MNEPHSGTPGATSQTGTEGETPAGAAADGAGADGAATATPDFAALRDSLPEDLRGAGALQPIDSFEKLARGYVHAQTLVGMDKLPVPGKDSPPEAWDEVYNRLGRPDVPEKYELDEIKDNPTYDPEMEPSFRQKCHELGLNNTQVRGLQSWYAETGTEKTAEIEAAVEAAGDQAEAEIQKEWGGDYQQKLAIAKRGAQALGGPDLLSALEEGLGGAALYQIAYNYGSVVGDDSGLIGVGSGGGGVVLTPDQARAEIDKNLKDKDFAARYTDSAAPKHKEAVVEMRRLYALAYPRKQQ